MTKYWIGVASHEHVQRAIMEGIAQVCHGRLGTLKQMYEGDGLIYYSPTYAFGGKERCRRFTAIGTIGPGDPYLFKISDDFIPWRRNVTYSYCGRPTPIEHLLGELSFITDQKKWGFPFRRGSFEISYQDFKVISVNMGIL